VVLFRNSSAREILVKKLTVVIFCREFFQKITKLLYNSLPLIYFQNITKFTQINIEVAAVKCLGITYFNAKFAYFIWYVNSDWTMITKSLIFHLEYQYRKLCMILCNQKLPREGNLSVSLLWSLSNDQNKHLEDFPTYHDQLQQNKWIC